MRRRGHAGSRHYSYLEGRQIMARRQLSTHKGHHRDDREKLEFFVRRVDEMGQNRLAQNPVRLGAHINLGPDGMSIEIEQPDEEAVRSFLLDFRQLTSDNEDIFVNRVYGICQRRLNREDIKQHLRNARVAYHQTLGERCHTLNVAGRTRTPKDIAHLWLNGYYFHSDADLRNELDGLDVNQRWLLSNLFVVYVVITSGYMNHVRNIVAQGLDEGWFNF
jgi:hypothetical protein